MSDDKVRLTETLGESARNTADRVVGENRMDRSAQQFWATVEEIFSDAAFDPDNPEWQTTWRNVDREIQQVPYESLLEYLREHPIYLREYMNGVSQGSADAMEHQREVDGPPDVMSGAEYRAAHAFRLPSAHMVENWMKETGRVVRRPNQTLEEIANYQREAPKGLPKVHKVVSHDDAKRMVVRWALTGRYVPQPDVDDDEGPNQAGSKASPFDSLEVRQVPNMRMAP